MFKLALRNLTKAYGDVMAVNQVTLEIAEGEFVSLLGPSGCGKTTTLRMIAGFIAPTEGVIEMDGQVLSSPKAMMPPERRQMSMIFQSYAIWPNMTVGENVAFGLKLRKASVAEIKQRTVEILKTVRMEHLIERYPAELSGGQQQRVALARSIVVKPSILLLDEPLSNLDANLREEMRFEIRRLHDEFRITTVYVTHDQGEAMVTSDRIAVMNAGRIEQVDDPYTLYNKPKTRFVAGFIGRTNFLEGRRDGDGIRFDGFSLRADAFAKHPGNGAGQVTLSIRPQSMKLHGRVPDDAGRRCVIRAKVVERAYLGEHWDYGVAPDGSGVQLRVTALPVEVHDVGDPVWVEFDPAQVAIIA